MPSFKPSHGASQMDACQKVSRGFFVACGDGAKVLDDIEEPFDKIAFAIEREIAFALDLAVRFGRDHHFDMTRFKALDESISVVTFVGKDGFGLNLPGERFGLCNVMNLARRKAHRERIAEGVNDSVNLCRQPAARSSYGFVAPFLSAPALC